MNRQIIQSMLSRIILGSGAVLLLPLLLSLYYGGPVLSFLIPALLALVLSLMLRKKNISPNVSLTPREGTAITALSWLSVSLLYAIPYILSGTLSPLDGLVESVSGLTGTGATVINDLSPLPPSILFFRAMTHWLGGLGIMVIFVALFPQAGRGSAKMVDAESTGPTSWLSSACTSASPPPPPPPTCSGAWVSWRPWTTPFPPLPPAVFPPAMKAWPTTGALLWN